MSDDLHHWGHSAYIDTDLGDGAYNARYDVSETAPYEDIALRRLGTARAIDEGDLGIGTDMVMLLARDDTPLALFHRHEKPDLPIPLVGPEDFR